MPRSWKWITMSGVARLYGILSILGWAWLLIVAIFLFIKLRKRKGSTRGFDVINSDEQH